MVAASVCTGVGAGPAKPESVNRGAVLGPAADRPQREQLIESHVAVERMAAGDSEQAFQAERGS